MPVVVRSRMRRPQVRVTALQGLSKRILDVTGESDAELGLEMVGDRRMRRLNREYRGRDRTTDVLAFPLRTEQGPGSPLLGDVVVSVPAAIRQWPLYSDTLDEELARLLIHGILHLLGYDHEKGPSEARRMRRTERLVWNAIQPVPRLTKGAKGKS